MPRAIRTDFIIFFVLATFLAAMAVPLQIPPYLGLPLSDGVLAFLPDQPYWHAQAMLFAYPEALFCGYLLTRPGKNQLYLLAGLWVAARLTMFVDAPVSLWLGAALDLALIAALFVLGGLPFFRAAKRWRSALPGAALALFVLAAILFHLGRLTGETSLCEAGLKLAAYLVIVMLFLMGGRVSAAATSGLLQKRGRYVRGIVQSRVEIAGIAAIALSAVLDLGEAPAWLLAAALWAAALAIVIRMIGWRFWRASDLCNISALHLGYGLIALGLAFKGGVTITGSVSSLSALHGVMVGGLGVLSVTVMGRTTAQRLRHPLTLSPVARICVVMIAGAAILRMAALIDPADPAFLAVAAGLWSLAMAGFCAELVVRFSKPMSPPTI